MVTVNAVTAPPETVAVIASPVPVVSPEPLDTVTVGALLYPAPPAVIAVVCPTTKSPGLNFCAVAKPVSYTHLTLPTILLV